jgi:hypothetical protein
VVDHLRVLARARLLAGALPREAAAFTLTGSADGIHRCAVCDQVITDSIEFRLRFANHAVLHFHGRCHDEWLVERQALGTP